VAKQKRGKLFKTCAYCFHLTRGTVTSAGRICGKEFITGSETDARECKGFEHSASFVCSQNHALIDIPVCLSRQDKYNQIQVCPRHCSQGELTKEIYLEQIEKAEIPEHKCGNKACSNMVPLYRRFCCLQCWSDRGNYEAALAHKIAVNKPEEIEKPKSKLRRISVGEIVESQIAHQSKLRRVAYV
jgi:hypothetical protein